MDLYVPDGTIVETPAGLRLVDDPAQTYVVLCQAASYNVLTAGQNIEAQLPEFRVVLDEVGQLGATYWANVDEPTLAIGARYRDSRAIILSCQSGMAQAPWLVASRMLLLPKENPESWGSEDEAITQFHARILLFMGIVSIKKWWRPQ